MSPDTRLEYVKYCIPDVCTHVGDNRWHTLQDGTFDPRRFTKDTGPYATNEHDFKQHNIALAWTIRSSRFRPHWKAMRQLAGPEFQEDFDDGWWYDPNSEADWRQRFWENLMVCQGLEGMGMMRPGLRETWVEKVKEWREKVARMERVPEVVQVGWQATLESPYLLGDLRICASGYVSGT